MHPPAIRLHAPAGNRRFLAAQVVIGGVGVAAGVPAPRVVPTLAGGLALEAQAHALPPCPARPAR